MSEKTAQELALLAVQEESNSLEVKMTQAYNIGYSAGRADSMRWIAVSERLPENQGEYLAFAPVWRDNDGLIFQVNTLKVFSFAIQNPLSKSYPISTGFYFNSIHYPEATHWMPLPDPPKEKE